MNQFHQHYHLGLMDFQKTQHMVFVHIHHLYHHLQQLELKLEMHQKPSLFLFHQANNKMVVMLVLMDYKN